jgi:NitT/TauT family transport system substrate-binding protein
MMLVARKPSGIATPTAMQGRKVGLWAGDLALPAEAFFTKYQLQVNRIPQSYTVNLFLRGGVDVASVMWYNEYHTILMSGVNTEELDLFFLKEHGIAFPEDGLYTLKTTYRQDPVLADAFARASLEGWLYAFDHPEEAVDIVLRSMREAKVPANRAHQKWMLERMRDLIMPEKNDEEMGQLSPSDYAAVTDVLRDMGHISTTTGYDDFVGRPDVHH